MKNRKNWILMTFLITLLSCKTNNIEKRVLITQEKTTKEEINFIPYYLKVYEADSLFITKNYTKCYEILDNLFKKYEPINMQNYCEYGAYIASSVMSGNVLDLDKNIRKGYLTFGSIGFFHPDSDTIYDRIFEKSKITSDSMKILSKIYKSKINAVLSNQIIKMFEDDQAARIPYYDLLKAESLQKKHQVEIEDIISKYGYLSYNDTKTIKCSNGFSADFTVLFLHQDSIVKKKYLPLLLKNLPLGKVLPNEYASIVDKIYMEKNKSLYGSFPDHELLYPKKIDSIRKSIGLPRYGYEIWADEILHPIFYK